MIIIFFEVLSTYEKRYSFAIENTCHRAPGTSFITNVKNMKNIQERYEQEFDMLNPFVIRNPLKTQ